MKTLLRVLLLVLIVAAAGAGFLYAKAEPIVLNKVKKDFRAATGSELNFEGAHLERRVKGDWTCWRIAIQKVKVSNTPGFRIPNMALLKDVSIVFEPLALVQSRWKIREMKAYLSKTSFEINAKGELNVSKLAVFQPGRASVAPGRFFIERLEWTYGTLYYSNFEGGKPSIERHDLKKRVAVFDRVSDPSVLFEAPLLEFINQLNKGSMGFARGKIQENVARHIGSS